MKILILILLPFLLYGQEIKTIFVVPETEYCTCQDIRIMPWSEAMLSTGKHGPDYYDNGIPKFIAMNDYAKKIGERRIQRKGAYAFDQEPVIKKIYRRFPLLGHAKFIDSVRAVTSDWIICECCNRAMKHLHESCCEEPQFPFQIWLMNKKKKNRA